MKKDNEYKFVYIMGSIGTSCGLLFGIATKHMPLCIVIGMCVGVILGFALDKNKDE